MMEMVRGIPHVTKREHIRCMVNSQPHPESVVVMIMVRIQFFFFNYSLIYSYSSFTFIYSKIINITSCVLLWMYCFLK